MLNEKLLVIGVVLLFLDIGLIFISSIISGKNSDIKSAGGIFIGPFPVFGFFSNKRMFYILLIIALIMYLFYYFALKRG